MGNRSFQNYSSPLDSEVIQIWQDSIDESNKNGMFEGSLVLEKMSEHTQYHFIFCIEDEFIVGFVKYEFAEDRISRIEIVHIEVMEAHQRQGIGNTLLSMLKEIARNKKLPIFAKQLNKLSIKCLKKSCFWEVDYDDFSLYKWSNLEEHKNHITPYVKLYE